MIVSETNTKKQEKAYKTFVEIIEEYNLKILSTKVYWDNSEEKEEYKKFWEEYNKIIKIQDKEERENKKLILFLKEDLKKLNKNEKKYKKIIKLHKEYLIKLGAMKNLKNTCKTSKTLLKGAKQIWNMQK